jgi:hypothetical protein
MVEKSEAGGDRNLRALKAATNETGSGRNRLAPTRNRESMR